MRILSNLCVIIVTLVSVGVQGFRNTHGHSPDEYESDSARYNFHSIYNAKTHDGEVKEGHGRQSMSIHRPGRYPFLARSFPDVISSTVGRQLDAEVEEEDEMQARIRKLSEELRRLRDQKRINDLEKARDLLSDELKHKENEKQTEKQLPNEQQDQSTQNEPRTSEPMGEHIWRPWDSMTSRRLPVEPSLQHHSNELSFKETPKDESQSNGEIDISKHTAHRPEQNDKSVESPDHKPTEQREPVKKKKEKKEDRERLQENESNESRVATTETMNPLETAVLGVNPTTASVVEAASANVAQGDLSNSEKIVFNVFKDANGNLKVEVSSEKIAKPEEESKAGVTDAIKEPRNEEANKDQAVIEDENKTKDEGKENGKVMNKVQPKEAELKASEKMHIDVQMEQNKIPSSKGPHVRAPWNRGPLAQMQHPRNPPFFNRPMNQFRLPHYEYTHPSLMTPQEHHQHQQVEYSEGYPLQSEQHSVRSYNPQHDYSNPKRYEDSEFPGDNSVHSKQSIYPYPPVPPRPYQPHFFNPGRNAKWTGSVLGNAKYADKGEENQLEQRGPHQLGKKGIAKYLNNGKPPRIMQQSNVKFPSDTQTPGKSSPQTGQGEHWQQNKLGNSYPKKASGNYHYEEYVEGDHGCEELSCPPDQCPLRIYRYDLETGCPTCDCCETVDCFEYCEHGYEADEYGCPICECAAPIDETNDGL